MDSFIVVMPLPFALISAALFLRTWKALLVVPLNVGAWWAASTTAIQCFSGAHYYGLFHSISPHLTSPYFTMCLAGFVGGLGVVLADSMCHPELLAPRRLFGAVLIGAVAGLPFAAPDFQRNQGFWTFVPCLALWQASMGTYLYFVCTHIRERVEMANSPGGRQE